jgi:selenocysteine lyase/cysteine desulfurase
VALAPHRQVDVKALDVDFYVRAQPPKLITSSVAGS